MKNLLLLLITFAFSLPESLAQQNRIPHLTLTDTAYIKIIAQNIDDSLIVHTKYCSAMPFRGCVFHDVAIKKPGIYYISYAMTKPAMCYFLDQDFELFLIPGDTMVVKLKAEFNENKELIINYQTTDPINDYYQAKYKEFGYYSLIQTNSFSKAYNDNLTNKNYVHALSIIDSTINQNNIFLIKQSKNLPKWFIDIEKAEFIFEGATHSLELYIQLNAGNQQKISFKAPELKNPNAFMSEAYYYFLQEYFFFKHPLVDNKTNGITSAIKFYDIQAHMVDSIFEGETKFFFTTCRLANLYYYSETLDDVKIADAYIKTNYPNITEKGLKYINSEKSKALQRIKTDLQKDEKAPNFFLKDIAGKSYNMSSISGKPVYLHFWATWCGPCIKEIPNLNLLHSKFGNTPAEIVNICMDNNPEKWKQIIEKEKLTGINLICAGNWETKLKSSYFIEELPHYVLIDKNGLVVTNKCAGPADIYFELVKLADNK